MYAILSVHTRDLHGITDRGNRGPRDYRGKNRGNGERVLTFTAVATVMGTAACLDIIIDYCGKTAVTAVMGTSSVVLLR